MEKQFLFHCCVILKARGRATGVKLETMGILRWWYHQLGQKMYQYRYWLVMSLQAFWSTWQAPKL
jgi:hypothetical protein